MPEPTFKLSEFLKQNLHYPQSAIDQNIQGKVTVKFVVDSTGKIINPMIPRSIHPSLDSEAIRVVSLMPNWKPGMQNGKAVNAYYTLPVNFRLTEQIQDPTVANEPEMILPKPTFALRPYLLNKIKYPNRMLSKRIGGQVTVEYTIDTTGTLINLQTVKSTDAEFTIEVYYTLQKMPKWETGTVDGKAKCMRLSQLFNFRITYKSDGAIDKHTIGEIIFTTPSFVSVTNPCY